MCVCFINCFPWDGGGGGGGVGGGGAHVDSYPLFGMSLCKHLHSEGGALLSCWLSYTLGLKYNSHYQNPGLKQLDHL